MNSDTDLLHQPDTLQQEPTGSFKSIKPLALLTAVLLIALVAGAGGYSMGTKSTPRDLITQLRPSVQIPTITQPPTVTIPEQTLTTVTKKQFNPSGTLAFYFTSQRPVFGPNDDPQDNYWLSDDPFKVCFNGDTYYFIRSTVYPGSADKYMITPYITETDTRKSYSLSFIGEVKASNGCVRITRWVDDNHLLREACGGDLDEFCECHLIDVQNLSLKNLGTTGCLLSNKK